MRRGWPLLVAAAVLPSAAGAGELVLRNGSRFTGELANEVLLLSTGSGLVEVVPGDVETLAPGEIRLRDGRVLHGALVGGRLKARTAFGELSVRVEELTHYRAVATVEDPSPVATASVPVASVPASPAPEATPPIPASADHGLPSASVYRDIPSPVAVTVTETAAARRDVATGARRLEVIVPETAVFRDAVQAGSHVGVVRQGEQVLYVDTIDRRLLILNHLVFDGGHWVKVRLSDGTVGWVQAAAVREAR